MTDHFPLTPLQHAMIAATTARPHAGVYVEQWIVSLREPVNAAALREAWAETVERHPALRTVFEQLDTGEPRQRVLAQVATACAEYDWTRLDAAEFERRWASLLDADQGRGFKEEAAQGRPWLRSAIVRASDGARFICTYHHALLDGRSLALLGRELFTRYDAKVGTEETLPSYPPVTEFREFVRVLQEQDRSSARAFWQSMLGDRPNPVLPYLRDATVSDLDDLATEEIAFELSAVKTAQLRALADEAGVSLHTLSQAAWALTLAGTTGVDDHVFGSIRACRKQPVAGIESMLGMLIHTLPFRLIIDWKRTLRELLQDVRRRQVELRAYETSEPDEIARYVGATNAFELFPTLLMYTDQPATAIFTEGGRPHPTRSSVLRERTDGALTLAVEVGEQVVLRLEYRTSLLDKGSAERLLGITQHLLEQFAARLDRPLSELTFLDEAAVKDAVAQGFGPKLDAEHATIYAAFAAQAASRPKSTALVENDESTSYEALSGNVAKVAAALHARHIDVGDRVCVIAKRSASWITAILAVWKALAVYVPIDPKYPEARCRQMLEDAQPKLIIADAGCEVPADYVDRAVALEDLLRSSDDVPAVAADPGGDDLAVILYTSGSTGEPKGVALTHANFASQNAAIRRLMDYSPDDRTTTLSSCCFDASLEEVFAPLCSGATLFLPPDEVFGSLEQLCGFASSARLTILDMPTSLWRELTNYLHDTGRIFPPTVRALMTGGERATATAFERFLAVGGDRIRWYNAYGPTEATICATVYEHRPGGRAQREPDEAPPIGRPIAGAVVVLVDRCGRPVPAGVPGELIIGGAGVSMGYWRREDLSAERFVARPNPALPEGRYYRTGDLARWRADGALEYIGRGDGQIKLRGFRIEPAEVEAVLARAEGVRDVVVRVATSPAQTAMLVAYVVPHTPAKCDAQELESFAARHLPEYMVPKHYLAIDALPLTLTGKVSDKLLPDPFATWKSREAAPERAPNKLEARILDLWRSVLPPSTASLHADFFECGGDSLKAMALAARLERVLETKLPYQILYRARTPAALARELKSLSLADELAPRVLLRRGDLDTPPLFLVHSLGGDAFIYREVVANLDAGLTVYGLQMPGLDGKHELPATVEELASFFLEFVREVQQTGPYRFAGYSSGGLLALEMARQLDVAGEKVELLGLIDSGLPSKVEAQLPSERGARLRSFARNLPNLARELWSLPADQRARRIGSFLSRLTAHFSPNKGEPDVMTDRELRECFACDISVFPPERIALIRRHFDSVGRYEPAPYRGHAYLFRSTRQPVFGLQSPTLGWESLIRGGLSIAEIVGAHAVLMEQPYATGLARALEIAIADEGVAKAKDEELTRTYRVPIYRQQPR